MKIFGKEIDIGNVIVPTILVGVIAGSSVYLEKQSLGWKAALGAGVATFVITVAQEFLKNNGKVSISIKRKKKWRLFPGQ